MSLFKLRGKLSRSQSLMLGILGFAFLVVMWWLLAEMLHVKKPLVEYDPRLPSFSEGDSVKIQALRDSIIKADNLKFDSATQFEKVYPLLPPPHKVITSYPALIQEDELVFNTARSIWLNLQGYFWALVVSIPIGFAIGLIPLLRGMFSKQVDAMRYLPLSALTGLFIIWFGIEDQMKIAFLAFGIIVYLLPVVVQRIDEVDDVYLMTVFTIGAKNWQTIRTVYLPSVLSKLIDDIRVLTAISWTYIIIAELVNRQGGIGSLIYIKARQGQIDKVFAILIVIILIGFIQDRIFVYLDKRLFPHKHYKSTLNGIKEVEAGIFAVLGVLAILFLLNAFVPSLASLMGSFAWILVIASMFIILFGEFKVQQSIKSVK